MKLLFLAFFVSAVVGCSSTKYRYHAVQRGMEIVSNESSGDILPLAFPRGTGALELASRGVVNVKQTPALHLRMKVKNESDRDSWTVNVLDQHVVFAGGVERLPAFASSHHPLPLITIQPRTSAVVDLFYPIAGTPSPDGFDFDWFVRSGKNVVADKTTFVRQPVGTPMTFENKVGSRTFQYEQGFGPNWWYQSDYPDHSILNSVPSE